MKLALAAATLALVACACACGDHGDGAAAPSRTVVAGTVLDRTTGEPIANARLTFPDGREARTNGQGRFVAADLGLGLSGELVARAEDGREGHVVLRPLARRQLEVVVYAGK